MSQPDTSDSHTTAAMQAASRLIGRHVPFGVLTPGHLKQLHRFKVLILSNVNMMNDDECETIRAWVRAGGALLASGSTSIVDAAGETRPDFALADVFGASLAGPLNWKEHDHFLAPTKLGQSLFPEFTAKYPAFCPGIGLDIQARPGAEVLATTTLPWPAPDPSKFASIHSNPPWVSTDRPELVHNRFGHGRAIYCASLIENLDRLRDTYFLLVEKLGGPFRLEVDAPACVEATLFEQPQRSRFILTLVNFQKELPNLPIEGIQVRVRLTKTPIQAIRLIPEGTEVPFSSTSGVTSFLSPRLETLRMFAIETKQVIP